MRKIKESINFAMRKETIILLGYLLCDYLQDGAVDGSLLMSMQGVLW